MENGYPPQRPENWKKRIVAVPIIGTALITIGAFSHDRDVDASPVGDPSIAVLPIDGAVQGDIVAVGLIGISNTPNFATLRDGNSDGKEFISTINQAPNVIAPNVGMAEVGKDGTVYVENGPHGVTELIADHFLLIDGTAAHTSAGRRLDTRNDYSMAAGSERCFAVEGQAGEAVVLNITAVNATAPTFITAYPGDTPRPLASVANPTPDNIKPNTVILPIGSNQQREVCVAAGDTGNRNTMVDVVADELVTFGAGVFNPTPSGAPERAVDTREGLGGTMLQPNGQIKVGGYGNPGDMLVFNLTTTGSTGPGFATAFETGTPMPNTSNANFNIGTTTPNLVFGRIGVDGTVTIANSEHSSVHIIVDVLGTIDASAIKNSTPRRLLDQRLTGVPLGVGREKLYDGLFEVPYDPNAVIPPQTPVNLIKTQADIPYGSSPSQTFDVYQSSDPSKRQIAAGMVTWYHGGGWSGGGKTHLSDSEMRLLSTLADQGYTIIVPNYRLIDEAPWPAQIIDTKAANMVAVAEATDLGIPNTDKNFMGGFSAGAYNATLAALAYDNPLFQPTDLSIDIMSFDEASKPDAVLNFAGPVDMEAWARNPYPHAYPYYGLNGLLGQHTDALTPSVTPLEPQYYAPLNVLSNIDPADEMPEVFIAFNPDDPVIPHYTQVPAIHRLSQIGHVTHSNAGSTGHDPMSGVPRSALLQFMRLVRP